MCRCQSNMLIAFSDKVLRRLPPKEFVSVIQCCLTGILNTTFKDKFNNSWNGEAPSEDPLDTHGFCPQSLADLKVLTL